MKQPRTVGASALLQYLVFTGTTLAAFAARMQVSTTTVHRWTSGKARPAFANRRQLQELTAGGVTADMFEREEGRS